MKKTDFKLLWPWFRWRNEDCEGIPSVFRGAGFPTEISYHSFLDEWHFEFIILGFGFYIERYPIKTKSKVVREATNNLLKAIKETKK